MAVSQYVQAVDMFLMTAHNVHPRKRARGDWLRVIQTECPTY